MNVQSERNIFPGYLENSQNYIHQILRKFSKFSALEVARVKNESKNKILIFSFWCMKMLWLQKITHMGQFSQDGNLVQQGLKSEAKGKTKTNVGQYDQK